MHHRQQRQNHHHPVDSPHAEKAGINAGLAGNVGSSFARQVAEEEHAVYVIELSSFQLDDMYDFRAEVAVLMNITPDHLDRYNYRMQNYVDAKFRITRNQTPDDWFIYFADDEVISRNWPAASWPPPASPSPWARDTVTAQESLTITLISIFIKTGSACQYWI